MISERFRPEQFIVNEVVDDFVRRGAKVSVLTQVPSYPHDRLYDGFPNRLVSITREEGARVIRFRTVLGYKSKLFRKVLNYLSFAVLGSICACLFSGSYEYIFVFHTGPLTQATPLLFLRRPARVLLWTQDLWPDGAFEYGYPSRGYLGALLREFVRAVYRRCDVIATTSAGFVPGICRLFPAPEKIHVCPQWVPAGVSGGAGSADPFLPDHQVEFTFAGAIGRMQNLENVVRGFSAAAHMRAGLRLNIFGEGSSRPGVEQLARRTGGCTIAFRGWVPMKDLTPWLRWSDFLVLPLIGEGSVSKTLPAKFQAYIGVGRPIVCVASGEVAQRVREEGLGIVAAPDDIEGIKSAFLSAARMSSRERALVAERAARLAAGRYSQSHIVGTLYRLLSGSDAP